MNTAREMWWFQFTLTIRVGDNEAMHRWKINRSQRKTALKMAKTIFDQIGISPEEASQLLMNSLILSLRDLLDSQHLQWLHPPSEALTVVWTGTAARQVPQRRGFKRLAPQPGDAAVDQAFEGCEALFDRYELDEDERDTLLTALPCLGLGALEGLLVWKKKPPFPEVTEVAGPTSSSS